MGLAEYKVIAKGDGWSMLHDGAANNDSQAKRRRLNPQWPQLPWHCGKAMKCMSACPGVRQAMATFLVSTNTR